MIQKHPVVSIGMPVRNTERTVSMSISSVLAQSYQEWELILIDDGSTDRTLEIAERFNDPRIRVFSDGLGKGLPERLNQAIALSRGRFFARMDGDDIAYPRRLEKQVGHLEKHPNIDLVGTWVVVFQGDGDAIGKRTPPDTHSRICQRPVSGFPIAHPTYFGRLEWFRRYGYNSKLTLAQDQDLLLRSYRFSHFANIPEILLAYRVEGINLKKNLVARYYLAKSLFQEFRRQGRWDFSVRAIMEQGLKYTFDAVAVSTGLNYRLLRHRANPLTAGEIQEWQRVWMQTTTHAAVKEQTEAWIKGR